MTIRSVLEEARHRTWQLVDGLGDEELATAAAEYLSPPVWDLGHIANFEELWLVQRLLDCGELHPGDNDTYDALAHPRQERPSLDLRDRDGCRSYMDEVRQRTWAALEAVRTSGDCDRLTRDGFVHRLIALHEHQHQETLLQTLQIRGVQGRYQIPFPVRRLPEPTARKDPWVTVPAGPSTLGTDPGPGVYDNESPAHRVHVDGFEMARYPVTIGEYLAFVEAGGYDDRSLWSERGRQWLDTEPHHAPMHWRLRDGVWHRVGIGCSLPVTHVPEEILSHATFFEAEAYAKWAGARLPTEAEWEKAARWDPATGATADRTLPTTETANIDQLSFAPSRVGAFPSGASPVGCEHMLGDVWEWTSSGFEAYPGFEPFPYDEYSKVFFGGDYRVLRGGSWATRAPCATATFRNWDHPYRRQIFSGVRLARDR